MDEADRRRWAAAADRYGDGWAQANAPDLGWLVEAVRPGPADRAVDVGTGAGHAARAIARHVASVDAIDPTPEMLAVAERLTATSGIANIAFVTGVAERLPFDDASLDIAISRFSVHHWPDPGAAFSEIARVVRPGGRIAIVDLLAPAPGADATFLAAVELLRDPGHVHSLAADEALALLGAAGIDATVARTWEIRHATQAWLDQPDPPAWRRDAVRQLLLEAPPGARAAFSIAPDGEAFSVGCGLLAGTRR